MKQAGASVKVSKNRSPRLLLKAQTSLAIGSLLRGRPLSRLQRSGSGAKVAIEFAKTNEQLVILGGSMGKTVWTLDGVKALATLPSLDELRAKMLGLLRRRLPRSPSSRPRRRPSSRACSGLCHLKSERREAVRHQHWFETEFAGRKQLNG